MIETLALLCAVALAPTVLMVRDTRVRLALVVFGAIAVFQSSASLDLPKLGYLGLVTIAVVMSLPTRDAPVARASILVGLVLGALVIISLLRGRDAVLVFRDAAGYFFLLAAGPLAVHFGDRLSERSG